MRKNNAEEIEKLEYAKKEEHKLEGEAKFRVSIPISIICNSNMTTRRVALFAYLYLYSGIHERMIFSLKHFLNWVGLKTDGRQGALNDKILHDLDEINTLDFISYIEKIPTAKDCSEIAVHKEEISYTNSRDRFGIVYLDEIQKIMNYQKKKKDGYFDSNVILLVFAYLRLLITRRQNELKPEERSIEGAENRRSRLPEVYNGTYEEIAEQLKISPRSVTKAVDTLIQLKLIILAEPKRLRKDDGGFWTPNFLFANAYKRDGEYYLIGGEDYYTREIKNKEKIMQQKYYRKYEVKEIRVA